MIKRKSTCGLCKPHKKWKKTNTKIKRVLKSEIEAEILKSRFDSCNTL